MSHFKYLIEDPLTESWKRHMKVQEAGDKGLREGRDKDAINRVNSARSLCDVQLSFSAP